MYNYITDNQYGGHELHSVNFIECSDWYCMHHWLPTEIKFAHVTVSTKTDKHSMV